MVESTIKYILVVERSNMRLAFHKTVYSDLPITGDSAFNPDKL